MPSFDQSERTRRYVQRLDTARSTKRRELEDEVDPVRGLSLVERGRWIAGLCAAASAILQARADRERVVDLDEPPARDYPILWRRLHAAYRERFRAAG